MSSHLCAQLIFSWNVCVSKERFHMKNEVCTRMGWKCFRVKYMLRLVNIILNDYLGHSVVLTGKPKCSKCQKYRRRLKVSCFFYMKHSSELVITDFENCLKREAKYGPNHIRFFENLLAVKMLIIKNCKVTLGLKYISHGQYDAN